MRLPFAPYARKEVILTTGLMALSIAALVLRLGAASSAAAALLLPLGAGLLYFLRDPGRRPPQGGGLMLSPADGRVLSIETCEEPRLHQGPCRKVTIFMSLSDVHVNRAPIDAQVVYTEHQPGKFLRAFTPEASRENERNDIALQGAHSRVLVRQIAGILARRIVCGVEPGERVARGDRLGMIKLGSRVEAYLPMECEILVSPGEKVRAGLTPIAREAPALHGERS